MECWTCQSNSGENRISPGPTIYIGKYWQIEHAYPVSREGWLVIVLKRHAEALHELTSEENIELSKLQQKLIKILHNNYNCEKEYLSCYAEGEHYKHIHIHIFAKPVGLSQELLGTKSFNILKPNNDQIIPKEKIVEYCKTLHEIWEKAK
jgi:diadenosine tetraphosphate (Ap4A) HIT family hydrolase